ncbi:hypothetical protein Anas_00815 [Armadillidium nasatum]|uniref:Uncharacterized protein n=1 Tax=Armadillidium nasatum TaxID=96803 RepID=A0A5N5TID3_9CRUS|nr:hypothetical protein Anas_00815 [Armadillidium nasatum]
MNVCCSVQCDSYSMFSWLYDFNEFLVGYSGPLTILPHPSTLTTSPHTSTTTTLPPSTPPIIHSTPSVSPASSTTAASIANSPPHTLTSTGGHLPMAPSPVITHSLHYVDNVYSASENMAPITEPPSEGSPGGFPPQPYPETDPESGYQPLPEPHHPPTHYADYTTHDFYGIPEKYRFPYIKYPQPPSAPRYTHEYTDGYSTPHYETQFHTVSQTVSDPWNTQAGHDLTPSPHPAVGGPNLVHYLQGRPDVSSIDTKPPPNLLGPNASIGAYPSSNGGPCFTGYTPDELHAMVDLKPEKKEED